MCGIVGYIGSNDIKDILLNGLGELEYRGYDSAGIAVLQDETFSIYKAVGKLENLREKTKEFHPKGFSIGIGHTRWATHGKPTELNAHPHIGESSYVVHNGIIENYQELKKRLLDDGAVFVSQTDTEVIVHLFESHLKSLNDPLKAFRATLDELKGAYAVLLITKSAPGTIFFAKHGSPMLIGLAGDDKHFASSDTPLIGLCTDVIYLHDGENGYLTADTVELFNENYEKTDPVLKSLPSSKLSAQKEGYRFFMEKEIYEQSQVIGDTLMGRLGESRINFEELD
jgi:glutamine---fructose-6-phosphate transaminase (isomerizing)